MLGLGKRKRITTIIVITLLAFGLIYLLRNSLVGDLYGNTLGKLYQGPSKESFTLSGEVPPYFSLDIISYYQKDRADECLRYNAKEGQRTSYLTGMKQQVAMSTTGSYKVAVPTSYYEQGCHLPIQSVKIVAYEHYDVNLEQTSMEQWAASLSFVNSAQLADEAPHFEFNKPMVYNSRCYNALRIMGGDLLVKILGCYVNNEHWDDKFKRSKVYNILRRNELTNQHIIINFKLNINDDRPYYARTWLNTEKGLKPCKETETSIFCEEPFIFRTFKMNGKTCTVYPSCTE